jgi:hypothetical protein
MIDRCQTPYYIGVDEDMILYPDAVERIYGRLRCSQDKVAMQVWLLMDSHLQRRIFGVKSYKIDILQKYPYSLTTTACDAEQVQRIQSDGYFVEHIYDLVGEHSPKWTFELIFERYLNLMEKYKQFGYDWIGEVPGKLWEILRQNPTRENLCALLGAYTSMISETPLLTGEKDFRHKRKEFETVKEFLS